MSEPLLFVMVSNSIGSLVFFGLLSPLEHLNCAHQSVRVVHLHVEVLVAVDLIGVSLTNCVNKVVIVFFEGCLNISDDAVFGLLNHFIVHYNFLLIFPDQNQTKRNQNETENKGDEWVAVVFFA